MEENVQRLLVVLSELGGRATYGRVRDVTGWTEDDFKPIRDHARSAGSIGVERGRGGIIFLLESPAPASEPAQDYEVDYYKKLLPAIESGWAESESVDEFIVEITAHKRVRGLGRWTIPDIVFVGKRTWEYVPHVDFFVQTIEVKRYELLDELAVFEALSHRRSVNYSYLCVVNLPMDTREYLKRISGIEVLCAEQGVGLVLVPAGAEADYERWEFPLDAEHHEPENEHLDGFIRRVLPDPAKTRVAKMIR